jgi:hypothetical protein
MQKAIELERKAPASLLHFAQDKKAAATHAFSDPTGRKEGTQEPTRNFGVWGTRRVLMLTALVALTASASEGGRYTEKLTSQNFIGA